MPCVIRLWRPPLSICRSRRESAGGRPKATMSWKSLSLGPSRARASHYLWGLRTRSSPRTQESMCAAQVYCLEWRLVCWATHISATTGEAPDSNMAQARWDVIRRQLPEAIRPPPRSREWYRRWVERWDGSLGLAPVGDEPRLRLSLRWCVYLLVLVPPP